MWYNLTLAVWSISLAKCELASVNFEPCFTWIHVSRTFEKMNCNLTNVCGGVLPLILGNWKWLSLQSVRVSYVTSLKWNCCRLEIAVQWTWWGSRAISWWGGSKAGLELTILKGTHFKAILTLTVQQASVDAHWHFLHIAGYGHNFTQVASILLLSNQEVVDIICLSI